KMAHGDRLGHSWRAGKLLVPGLASDHAAMIRTALALHEATGEQAYLERALAWQATLDRHYANAENGGYFLTADDAVGLVVRPNSTSDDATPNPNALAAQNLIRLAFFTGQHAWRDKADRLFEGTAASAAENVFAHLALLNALDLRLRAAEIVVVGKDERANELLAAARRLPFLDRVVLHASPALAPGHPAYDKIKAAAQSAAFVCVGETCSLPVSEPDAMAEAARAAWHSSRVHRLEEVAIRLGVAQLVEEEIDRIHGSHRIEDAAQDVHLLELIGRHEQFLLAGAGARDVHGREGAFVGHFAVENYFRIAGALELLEDHFVHTAAGIDQRGRDNGERTTFFDVARRAEEALRPLQRVRVDAAGEHLTGGRHHRVVGTPEPRNRIKQNDHIAAVLDQALGLFDHHFRDLNMARCRFVEGRGYDLALHRTLHVGH